MASIAQLNGIDAPKSGNLQSQAGIAKSVLGLFYLIDVPLSQQTDEVLVGTTG